MFLNDLRKKYNEMELIKKTYMLVALICAALSVISLTINILLNFGIVQIGISFFVFMMAYLFYYMANSEKKFERLIFIIFIIVTVIIYPLLWINSSGSYGYIPYLYILNAFLVRVLLNTKSARIVLLLEIITVISLFIIEVVSPDMIVPYATNNLRIADVSISFIIVITFIFLLVGKLVNEYGNMIIKLEKVQEELRIISYTDELSGVYNRRYTLKKLEENLKNNDDSDISVIMFDIDDFKIINDTYGHSIGDEVILGVSELLTLNTRENDIVGRIGGEEFLIVLSNANYGLALTIAEKLRLLISEKKWSKENLSVTVSGGVYTKEDTDTVEKMLEKVDVYLYKSKREGKNIIN